MAELLSEAGPDLSQAEHVELQAEKIREHLRHERERAAKSLHVMHEERSKVMETVRAPGERAAPDHAPVRQRPEPRPAAGGNIPNVAEADQLRAAWQAGLRPRRRRAARVAPTRTSTTIATTTSHGMRDGSPEARHTMADVSQGPVQERKPCEHDSMRGDMTLDDHCLRCGADGYWHNGHRHDRPHPSGKVLVALGCAQT